MSSSELLLENLLLLPAGVTDSYTLGFVSIAIAYVAPYSSFFEYCGRGEWGSLSSLDVPSEDLFVSPAAMIMGVSDQARC